MAFPFPSSCDFVVLQAAVSSELTNLVTASCSNRLASEFSIRSVNSSIEAVLNGVSKALEDIIECTERGEGEMPLHLLAEALENAVPTADEGRIFTTVNSFIDELCLQWVAAAVKDGKEEVTVDPYAVCCHKLRVWLAVLSFHRIQHITASQKASASSTLDGTIELLSSADAAFFALDVYGCGLLGVPEVLPFVLAISSHNPQISSVVAQEVIKDIRRSPTALLSATARTLAHISNSTSAVLSLSQWRQFVVRTNITPQQLNQLLKALTELTSAFSIAAESSTAIDAATLSRKHVWRFTLEKTVVNAEAWTSLRPLIASQLQVGTNSYDSMIVDCIVKASMGMLVNALYLELPCTLATLISQQSYPLAEQASKQVFQSLGQHISDAVDIPKCRIHSQFFMNVAASLGIRFADDRADEIAEIVAAAAQSVCDDTLPTLLNMFQAEMSGALGRCGHVSGGMAVPLQAPASPRVDGTHAVHAKTRPVLTLDTAPTSAAPLGEEEDAEAVEKGNEIPTLRVSLLDMLTPAKSPALVKVLEKSIQKADVASRRAAHAQANTLPITPPDVFEDRSSFASSSLFDSRQDSPTSAYASNAVMTALQTHRSALKRELDVAIENLLSQPPGGSMHREAEAFQVDRLRNLRAQIAELDAAITRLSDGGEVVLSARSADGVKARPNGDKAQLPFSSSSATITAPTGDTAAAKHSSMSNTQRRSAEKAVRPATSHEFKPLQTGLSTGKGSVQGLQPVKIPSLALSPHFMEATKSSSALLSHRSSASEVAHVAANWHSALRNNNSRKSDVSNPTPRNSQQRSQPERSRSVSQTRSVTTAAPFISSASFARPTESYSARLDDSKRSTTLAATATAKATAGGRRAARGTGVAAKAHGSTQQHSTVVRGRSQSSDSRPVAFVPVASVLLASTAHAADEEARLVTPVRPSLADAGTTVPRNLQQVLATAAGDGAVLASMPRDVPGRRSEESSAVKFGRMGSNTSNGRSSLRRSRAFR